MSKDWILSERAQQMKSSVIRELLKLTQNPEVISFAGGLPAEDFFPVEDIKEAAIKAIKENGKKALQYGSTEGYPALREFLSEFMTNKGVKTESNEILITTGSQQGLDLCGKVFLNDHDHVITSKPTYLGAIQAFNAYFPEYHTLASDEGGMIVDGLEDLVKEHKPKFIYLVPTFQNPDGRTLSKERRQRILDISIRYGVPVIEDDPYSLLTYTEPTPPPAMVTMAKEHVVYMSTFSKMVCPGFRLAWVVAPTQILDKFIKMKQGSDLHSSTLAQYILLEYLKTGKYKDHIENIKNVYGERMQVMKECIAKYFPPEVKTSHPTGGMFFWVELPKGMDTTKMFEKAVEKNVAYVPGSAFHPDGTGQNTMRLNFSKSDPDKIEDGMKRLSEVIKEELANLQ
ncbi:MAG: PLP-dependent aminotransferase family protein [Candidatus Zixiibacteriota bacterium]